MEGFQQGSSGEGMLYLGGVERNGWAGGGNRSGGRLSGGSKMSALVGARGLHSLCRGQVGRIDLVVHILQIKGSK